VRRYVFKVIYARKRPLDGCLDEINLEFVEREAIPGLLVKLSIQIHLAVLSFSNTVFIDVSGVDRFNLPFITGFIRPSTAGIWSEPESRCGR